MRKLGWGAFVVAVLLVVPAWADPPNPNQFTEKFKVISAYNPDKPNYGWECYMTLQNGNASYDVKRKGMLNCPVFSPGDTLSGRFDKHGNEAGIEIFETDKNGKGRTFWYGIQTYADQLVLQKTFDATLERVYAAEVQAVGPTLKNAVKEACQVNSEARDVGVSGDFIAAWTAVCGDAGDGKTTVTLQEQGGPKTFGYSEAIKKDADNFWGNMDVALKSSALSGGIATSSPQAPQAGSEVVAIVQISSEPSGADITVDGDYAGSTPSQMKLKPGAHAVKITKKGFEPWERSIKVEAGDSRNIAAELEKSN